jgi:dihydropteroate synthase
MAKSKLQALVLAKASQMVKAGAKMLDIGAESSRPFSLPVSEKEEIKRLSLALSSLRKEFKNIIISIDTYKFKTAKFAAQEGIDVINDISGLRKNPQIVSLIKKYHLGFVLMHMKSSPRTMQLNPKYRNVTEEIIDFFKERLNFLGKNGITASQILIDPGIGFGKRASDNLKIIEELYKLKILGLPIFIGVSRKSFIGKVLNREPDERLSGTVCANIVSCFNGANILRVHDVKENFAAVKIFSAITNN